MMVVLHMVVRDEVAAFSVMMEMALQRNDYKGGWQGMSPSQIMNRIYDEVRQLNAARKLLDEKIDPEMVELVKADEVIRAAVKKEALNVANFCMFMVDTL